MHRLREYAPRAAVAVTMGLSMRTFSLDFIKLEG
jgi:hypothetical protein